MPNEVTQAIATLKELKKKTPDYAGSGPKPRHYQAIHAAYHIAIDRLSAQPAPVGEGDVALMIETGTKSDTAGTRTFPNWRVAAALTAMQAQRDEARAEIERILSLDSGDYGGEAAILLSGIQVGLRNAKAALAEGGGS